MDFYPRPPRGGRQRTACLCRQAPFYFYPRPPRGGRLDIWAAVLKLMDFYPRPPRGGRHVSPDILQHLVNISIHVLREEDDVWQYKFVVIAFVFLSTSSARRTTPARPGLPPAREYFYPRPPRGGRPGLITGACDLIDFYPRPPRGGRRRDHRGGPKP